MANDKTTKLIQEFFAFFGLTSDQVKIENGEGDMLKVTLLVDQVEAGRYIGRFAQTLDSLQLIISLMINNGQAEHRHVSVDVGGYREERTTVLQNMATQAAQDVESTGEPHALPPLSATDRRQIHLFFQDHATLTTYSEGQGQDRRLVIAPKAA